MIKQEDLKSYGRMTFADAKLFVEGDEDGFITRYYDDEDVHPDGRINTYGIMGEHEIKVPYVLIPRESDDEDDEETYELLSPGFGVAYLVVFKDENGVTIGHKFIMKEEFEKQYTLLEHLG